mmetsp:Transcript_13778/g.32420  ORF Transcript_13778/g.32420 Transcript_13778/m.32420 type:complete len:246 (+) Transcript_13778:441-1178(+)
MRGDRQGCRALQSRRGPARVDACVPEAGAEPREAQGAVGSRDHSAEAGEAWERAGGAIRVQDAAARARGRAAGAVVRARGARREELGVEPREEAHGRVHRAVPSAHPPRPAPGHGELRARVPLAWAPRARVLGRRPRVVRCVHRRLRRRREVPSDLRGRRRGGVDRAPIHRRAPHPPRLGGPDQRPVVAAGGRGALQPGPWEQSAVPCGDRETGRRDRERVCQVCRLARARGGVGASGLGAVSAG